MIRLTQTILRLTGAATTLLLCAPVSAQLDFEHPPINYQTAPVSDRVYKLQQEVDQGKVAVRWDAKFGWLPDLLRLLEVSPESQTLVFSQTSLQITKISAARPRALYFNDDVYVGWVQQGDVLELSAVDPVQGAIFYSVAQTPGERPVFRRDRGECLSCHASSRTKDVPGYLVRSVFAGADGRPHFGLGSETTDMTTAFSKRYGGWYVHGQHGQLRHRGNSIARDDPDAPLDPELGANQERLPSRVNASHYLRPTSDLVALMALEHQSQMHNLITRASYETRQALDYDRVMNAALDRPSDFRSETCQRRIQSVAENLVKFMLFSGEFALTSPVSGVSPFADEFAALGPKDSRGRSLRQWDLQRRMFRYPCSYLVYSESFDSLPKEVLQVVASRMGAILDGRDRSAPFRHLTTEDRGNLREILDDAKPNFLPQSTATK